MALEIPDLASGNPQLQKAIVKMVKAEQRPIDKFDEKIKKVDDKLKLTKDLKTKFTDLRESITPFKSVRDFRELKATSSDPTIVDASGIDKSIAEPGVHEIEVISLASPNSIMTKGFPDKDHSEVGVGYITFNTAGGESKDVYINSSNNTLEGVAKAINASNSGVKASVINDGTDADEPFRLIITGSKTGWKNDIDYPEFNFLDGDFDLDIERTNEAKSAIIKYNGQPIMVDENNAKDLIPGVTVNLKKAKPGDIVKLEIQPDTEKVGEKAKGLVDKLNAVLSFIQTQNQLGPDSRNDPSKALGGDVSIQTLEFRLRNIIQQTESDLEEPEIKSMRDMGIIFNKSGTLDFDPKKFQQKLEKNFDEVAVLLSGNTPLSGFAHELGDLVESVTRTGDGIVTIKESTLSDQKKRLNTEKEKVTDRAEKKIEKLKVQFGKAEEALNNMQSMGSQLAASIGSAGARG